MPASVKLDLNFSEDLAAFFDLHQRRWQSKGERGSFSCTKRRQFYTKLSGALASRHRLEFWLLELDGTPVAGEFDLCYGETVYNLQAAFNPAFAGMRPGHVLRTYLLSRFVAAGIRRYDFLAGKETYKAHWGGRTTGYHDIHFALPQTAGSTCVRFVARWKTWKARARECVPPGLWAAARRLNRTRYL